MITSLVALGDSFTEGLNDVLRADGRHRGWADRVADELLVAQDLGQIGYANLAVRGRLMRQVVAEQVPVAAALRADLVTLGAGVNDALRRTFNLDCLATDLESGVRQLRAAGSEVLLFAFGDPARRSRVFGRISTRMAQLRSATLAIAQAYDCYVVDFWGVAVYDDDRLWSSDRLHLSALGHRITAQAVLDALGMGYQRWQLPLSDPPRSSWRHRRSNDLVWAGSHAGPWLARRVRRVSSGEGIVPKNSVMEAIHR